MILAAVASTHHVDSMITDAFEDCLFVQYSAYLGSQTTIDELLLNSHSLKTTALQQGVVVWGTTVFQGLFDFAGIGMRDQ